MQLREYQETAINEARRAFLEKNKCVCIVLPCRAGKSVIAAKIAKNATDKGNRVLFIVHRKELCEQITETFVKCEVNMELCQVGMVQTISRRLQTTEKPSLIIVDEFHHTLASGYLKVYEAFNESLILGFTATPVRLKEKGLGEICNKLIIGVTAQYLIDNKYMSDYVYYNNKLVNTDSLHIRMGEYKQDEVNSLMNDKVVYTGAVENYLKYANGKSAIVYCTSVENSKNTAEEFIQAGITSGYITGSQEKQEREKAMEDFKNGNIKILTSCEVISEGIDIADCECCILLRPTKSLSLYIQQSMRCLTYKEGKIAIILDLVGNYAEHGLPTQERNWSLDGVVKKDKNENIECEECFAVYALEQAQAKYGKKIRKCPFCGYEKPAAKEREKKEKELKDAELEEIDKNKKHIRGLYDCTTFEDFEQYREQKGYKKTWVYRQCWERGIRVPNSHIIPYERWKIYAKPTKETKERNGAFKPYKIRTFNPWY